MWIKLHSAKVAFAGQRRGNWNESLPRLVFLSLSRNDTYGTRSVVVQSRQQSRQKRVTHDVTPCAKAMPVDGTKLIGINYDGNHINPAPSSKCQKAWHPSIRGWVLNYGPVDIYLRSTEKFPIRNVCLRTFYLSHQSSSPVCCCWCVCV
jgi:hypothetical protein